MEFNDYCLIGIIINNYVVNQKKYLIEEFLSSLFKDDKVIVIDEINLKVVNLNQSLESYRIEGIGNID